MTYDSQVTMEEPNIIEPDSGDDFLDFVDTMDSEDGIGPIFDDSPLSLAHVKLDEITVGEGYLTPITREKRKVSISSCTQHVSPERVDSPQTCLEFDLEVQRDMEYKDQLFMPPPAKYRGRSHTHESRKARFLHMRFNQCLRKLKDRMRCSEESRLELIRQRMLLPEVYAHGDFNDDLLSGAGYGRSREYQDSRRALLSFLCQTLREDPYGERVFGPSS